MGCDISLYIICNSFAMLILCVIALHQIKDIIDDQVSGFGSCKSFLMIALKRVWHRNDRDMRFV